MTSLQQTQQLIEELGPASEELAEVLQHGESAWSVIFEDDKSVDLDFMEDQNKLVLSMELGAPPEDRRASTYEFILLYNFSWKESGGIKMGLDAPEGNVVMMFELNTAGLELQTLQNVLMSFFEKGSAWTDLIAAGVGNQEFSEQLAMDQFLGTLRV